MAKRSNHNVIKAIDLFCGGGGTSTGLAKAAKKLKKIVELIAVNHWDVAIATHSINHKYAQHLCTGIDNVDPRKLVPSGRLDLMVASPECTHHSRARGGKPMNDQSRSSGWHVLRFAEALYIDNIVLENVVEWQEWGPIGADGRPLKSKKGQLFQQFIAALRALGYNVEYRALCCADYGDPTSRERLFIIARRGNKKITWPEPTHAPASVLAEPSLFSNDLKPWRTARECIDWSIESHSIFDRTKPLAENTLTRIEAGLKKFNGIEVDLKRCIRENLRPYVCFIRKENGTEPDLEPFVGVLRNHADANSIEEPLPALTAGGQHFGVVEPCIITPGGAVGQGRNPHSVNEPFGAVLTNDRRDLVEGAFVLQTDQTGGKKRKKGVRAAVRSVDQPVPTLVTKANTCVVESFILPNEGVFRGNQPRSLDRPMNTVTAERGAGHLVEPFLSVYHGNRNGSEEKERNSSLNKPLTTQDTSNRFGVVEPFILPHPRQHDVPHSVDRPMRTITASSSDLSFCESFLLGQQSCAAPRGVDEPVPTVAGAGAISLTESFLVPNYGEREGQEARCQSVDKPMPTVTASKGAGNLVTPHLIPQFSQHGPKSVDQPLGTVTTTSRGIGLTEPFIATTNHGEGVERRLASLDKPMRTITGSLGEGLVEPFFVEYYGTLNMSDVDSPLPTVTGTNRFALVEGTIVEKYMLDIRFRMLQPKELAKAQGFPEDYIFKGTKAEQVKQIGNAVPPNTAMSLILSCLSDASAEDLRAAA